jgi:hypothetical protein
MFENANLIHRYTRAEAIADGVLIGVSAVARGAGIRYPVALTRAAWERSAFATFFPCIARGGNYNRPSLCPGRGTPAPGRPATLGTG